MYAARKIAWMKIETRGTGRYGVQGIPMLVIIGRNGELVTSQGRNEVSQMGSAAFDRW